MEVQETVQITTLGAEVTPQLSSQFELTNTIGRSEDESLEMEQVIVKSRENSRKPARLRIVLVLLLVFSLCAAVFYLTTRQNKVDGFATASMRLALYESLVDKVMEREAFSPIKDERWGETFESRLENYDIRQRFLNATDDTELYRAINMLNCARRDSHLWIDTIDDGIDPDIDYVTPEVPIRFMADYTGNLNGFLDVSSAAFFVSRKGTEASVAEVQVGDWLIEVNDRPLAEFVEFMVANFRMSTIAGGYWQLISEALAEYEPLIAQDYYRGDGTVKYKFRRDYNTTGGASFEYSIMLSYSDEDFDWIGDNPATNKNLPSHWQSISETEDYRLYQPTGADYPYRTLLLEWIDFEDLPTSTEKLMKEVEKKKLLDYDVIVDTTISSGGGGSPYVIERFAKVPFQTTWGNVRCSDILETFALDCLDGAGEANFDWIVDVVLPSCENGAEYSKNQPFKLDFEGLCEDGILDPHPVHFTGNFILLTGPEAGSQLDQFTSMWIDNNIGLSMGMPSGGYSNTWEYEEDLVFPDDGSPAIFFQYSIGHTVRANGEILEGNPAQPTIPYVLTHDNFQTYFADMIMAAQEELNKLRQPI
jgi:hypothetical protein